MPFETWIYGLLPISILLVVHAVREWRRKAWAFLALDVAAIAYLLLVPVQTHAVKIDLTPPAPATRK